MKKKLFSLALALALCLGLAVPAFAAGDTVSVTDAGITFDAISTSKYDNAKDELGYTGPEAMFLYALGMVGTQIDDTEYGYGTLWAYLVHDDVKLDFHVKKGEKFSITGYYLTKSGEGFYDSIFIRDMWFSPKEDDSDPIDKEFIDDFFPGANYLVCCQGQEYDPNNTISIVFADENGEPCTVPAFSDVEPTAYYAAPVAWAVQNEITNGYGSNDKFAPDVNCTEAQILTFLYRAADKPSAAKSPVSVAASYQDAINWAYEKGMIDGSFKENTPCTRATAVKYIWQAFDKPKAEKASSFTDVDKGADYAEAVSWAVEKGVTNGYGGTDTFAPDRVCNRGEIVTFLYRAYKN